MTQQQLLFGGTAIRVTPTLPAVERKRLTGQCERLLNVLLERPITNRAIFTELGILNGTGRISDLRAAGYDIRITERDHATGRVVYALFTEGAENAL